MDGNPITHKNFRTVADIQEVDSEDAPIDVLAEVKNLTPFRKMGSLQLCPGHSVWKAKASLPRPAGYQLIDFYDFSIDRDEKAVTMLVYRKIASPNDTRFYINPYWNPLPEYSNYGSVTPSGAASAGGEWVTEWLELTEKYSMDVDAIPSTRSFTALDATFSPALTAIQKQSGYFDGWFLIIIPANLNTVYGQNMIEPYNHLTSTHGHNYAATTHTFTTIGATSNWTIADTIHIVRFPVRHMYKKNTNIPDLLEIEDFDAIPTQFIAAQNELRMPCGQDNRPLLLTTIKERKYFTGNDPLSYDGFWFDFQTPPQVQKGSAVSSFVSRTVGAVSATGYFHNNFVFNTVAAGAFCDITRASGTGTLKVYIVPDGSPYITNPTILYWKEAGGDALYVMANNDSLFFVYNGAGQTTTAVEFVANFNQTRNPLYPNYTAANATADVFSAITSVNFYQVLLSTSIFFGTEAGGNYWANNYFLGTMVESTNNTSAVNPTSVQRGAFIINAVLDDRSSILMAHGTLCSDSYGAGPTYPDIDVRFTLWFSRRITGFSFFHKDVDTVDIYASAAVLESLVIITDEYPYWMWKKDVEINDTSLFGYFSINDFSKAEHGERAFKIKDISSATLGKNVWTRAANDSYWFVLISPETFTLDQGEGFHYISECNRYLDQDVTMNYTKGVFLGQTNGRYFIVGCKNDVEEPLFENQDTVFGNLYAAGISQYDIFLRDRALQVFMGDKDTIQNIHNHKGYLILTKQSNVYAMDVNTGDELQYRTIDTMAGRGTSYPDGMCQTPYGIVMPANDTIWIINPDGIEPLMTPINGRLNLYRNLVNNYSPDIQSVFYNLYNELMVFITWVSEYSYVTEVFIYNFTAQGWTNYQFTGISGPSTPSGMVIRKVRTNSDKNVCMLNWGNASNFNITKIDEAMVTPTFYTCLGAIQEIIWQFKTHQMPYAGKHEDISSVVWMQLNADIKVATTKDLIFKLYADQENAISSTKTVSDTTLVRNKNYNLLPPHINECEALAAEVTNSSASHPFINLAINSFTLWLTKQAKKMGNL